MGIFGFLTKQFIDVIQWTEDGQGVLAYQYPMRDMEIQNGGQLVVRETQQAIFINEGKFADKFNPGTYTLTTNTLPILTNLKNWDKFFESPFKSDVYFFSTREQLDQKWGTGNPITIRDKEFGPMRIRAFGNYSYKIADVESFYRKLSGTVASYTVSELEGQLRGAILTTISSAFGGSDVAFVDMAANQQKFSDSLKAIVLPVFQGYGLELTSFYVQNLSLPEELERQLDKVASMRMVGNNLQQYAQFQAADSIETAAANPGGVAGVGVGLGAGVAMGQMMSQALSGVSGTPGATAQAEDPIATLERLGGLLKSGILTQAEFDAKKVELLSKIK